MRFSSYALPAFAANLVAALPAPQEIDLDMVIAAPDPTYTETLGLTAQVVTYDTTAIAAAATAAVSSVSIDVTDVLDGTAIVSKRAEATPTAASNDKRGLGARGAACTALPTGVAAYALSADTASDFRANGSFASMASNAPVPTGYVSTVVNAGGANSAYGYLGYSNLASYDTNACAAKCSKTVGCMAFNIYFERDPSVDPGTGNSDCANPPSVVYAKCALWGGPLTTANAVNKGQMRNQFEVAVAGSNAYQNTSLAIPAGYSLKGAYNNVAINAPYDIQGYNTYITSTIFTEGPFNIQLCADYCSAQTKYNLANPAQDGTPPKSCSFFNTYILYKNSASSPQGQYCAIYTEAWGDSYAVNSGQTRGSDRYFVGYSYTFSNSSSPGIAPKVGDTNGAIYQARQDMTYFPSQLTSTFQPYCSSLLGYTAPLTTVTASTTVTPLSTTTATVTSTIAAQNNKRDDAADATLSLVPWILNYTSTTGLERRAAPTVPAVLTKYPTAVQSGACSLIVTQQTVVSTTTVSTVTTTAPTQISTATSVVNVAAAPVLRSGKIQVQNPSSGYNGLYVRWNHGEYGLLNLQSQASLADSFSLDSENHLTWGSNTIVGNTPGGEISSDTILMTPYRAMYRQNIPNPTIAIDPSTGFISASNQYDGRNKLQICAANTATAYGNAYFSLGGPYLIVGSVVRANCELAKLKFVSA